jgi:hypothetical protein
VRHLLALPDAGALADEEFAARNRPARRRSSPARCAQASARSGGDYGRAVAYIELKSRGYSAPEAAFLIAWMGVLLIATAAAGTHLGVVGAVLLVVYLLVAPWSGERLVTAVRRSRARSVSAAS